MAVDKSIRSSCGAKGSGSIRCFKFIHDILSDSICCNLLFLRLCAVADQIDRRHCSGVIPF